MPIDDFLTGDDNAAEDVRPADGQAADGGTAARAVAEDITGALIQACCIVVYVLLCQSRCQSQHAASRKAMLAAITSVTCQYFLHIALIMV